MQVVRLPPGGAQQDYQIDVLQDDSAVLAWDQVSGKLYPVDSALTKVQADQSVLVPATQQIAVGNGTVAAIDNWYYPDARGLNGTLQRMGTQIGTDAISGVLKEFWPDIKRKWLHKRDISNAD